MTVLSGEIIQCAVKTAIQVEGSVEIQQNGRLDLMSDKVIIHNGFRVPQGAKFSIHSGGALAPAP